MSDLFQLVRRIVAKTLSRFDGSPERPVAPPESPRMRVVPRTLPPWQRGDQAPRD